MCLSAPKNLVFGACSVPPTKRGIVTELVQREWKQVSSSPALLRWCPSEWGSSCQQCPYTGQPCPHQGSADRPSPSIQGVRSRFDTRIWTWTSHKKVLKTLELSCQHTSVALSLKSCSTTTTTSLHRSHGTDFCKKINYTIRAHVLCAGIQKHFWETGQRTIWGLFHTFCWQCWTAPQREAVLTFWHQYGGPRAHCSVPNRGLATASKKQENID